MLLSIDELYKKKSINLHRFFVYTPLEKIDAI